MRLATEKREMLRAQGIDLIVPSPCCLPRADVAVLPGPGSPEYSYYARVLRARGIPWVSHVDPLTGLSLALAYPSRRFNRIVFGVDPGSECGVIGFAGPVAVIARKVACARLGETIASTAMRIPHASLSIMVGDGEGALEAVHSLEDAGLSYTLVPERGSTVEHSRGPLERVLRDKDLLASLTIALRGVIGSAANPVGLP